MKARILAWFWALLALFGCEKPMAPEFKGVSNFRFNRQNENRKSQVQFDLKLHNPNAFKIKIIDYDLDVFLNGDLVGEAMDVPKAVLPPGETASVTCAVQTSLKDLVGGLGGMLGGLFKGDKTADLRLQGSVRVKALGLRKRIPITIEEEIPVFGGN